MFPVPPQPGSINGLCSSEPEKCSHQCIAVEWNGPSSGGSYDGYHVSWEPRNGPVCPECWDIVSRHDPREYRICGLEPNTEYEVSVFTRVGNSLNNALSSPADFGGSSIFESTGKCCQKLYA